jgi:hypothetical protein
MIEERAGQQSGVLAKAFVWRVPARNHRLVNGI